MGSRKAFIVATDEYDDSRLKRLRAPVKDAEALKEVLSDTDLGAFDVHVMHNQMHYEVAEMIEGALADSLADDTIVLHFSCHGLKNDAGRLFLAARDTKLNRLSSTSISSAWLADLMQDSRARRVALFLDCCFAGAFARGVVHRGGEAVHVEEQFAAIDAEDYGRGRAVITASAAMEYAIEGDKVKGSGLPGTSVFTSALVSGIQGAADADGDGRLELGELYRYVYSTVRSSSASQAPTITTFGQQGDFVIARSPYVPVPHAPLPDAIITDLEQGTLRERRLAIIDLKDLTAAQDLALAGAAVARLQALREDDSRSAAELAQESLHKVRTVLEQEEVVIHTHTEDGAPKDPSANIRLTGPPIALVGAVKSDDPRVRGIVRDGILRVRLLHAEVETLSCTLTITNETGTYPVMVRVEGAARSDPSARSWPPQAPAKAPAAKKERETALKKTNQATPPPKPPPRKTASSSSSAAVSSPTPPPSTKATTGELAVVSPEEVANKRFTPVRLREGYDMGEVDQFLDEVAEELRRRAKAIGELLFRGNKSPFRAGLTKEDVANKRFTTVRFREGYDMGEVDLFLDQVEVTLEKSDRELAK